MVNFTSADVMVGISNHSKAIVPVTKGAAILVPPHISPLLLCFRSSQCCERSSDLSQQPGASILPPSIAERPLTCRSGHCTRGIRENASSQVASTEDYCVSMQRSAAARQPSIQPGLRVKAHTPRQLRNGFAQGPNEGMLPPVAGLQVRAHAFLQSRAS
jgi:hypothetical protein